MAKQRVSLYWNFVLYYCESRRRIGYNLGVKLAEREARELWSAMQDSDKRLFEENNSSVLHLIPGCSSASNRGQPERAPRPKMGNQQRRAFAALERERLDFVETIKNFEEHVFVLASIRSPKNNAMPCEITLVRWSIERGIITYFHVVCDPEISGNEYTNFRRLVGDREAIVRIKNTTNSVDNRKLLRDALLAFCGDEPLLVSATDYHHAKDSMGYFASNEPPIFTILRADEVFQNLSQRIQHFRLTMHRITSEISRSLNDERLQHLKCSLHRELPQYQCSLKACLGMSYVLANIFTSRFGISKKPISHCVLAGACPRGEHYRGTGISEEDKELEYSW